MNQSYKERTGVDHVIFFTGSCDFVDELKLGLIARNMEDKKPENALDYCNNN